jgi:hypothetical protein
MKRVDIWNLNHSQLSFSLRFIVIIDLCLCQLLLTNLDVLILSLETRLLMVVDNLFQVCVGDGNRIWLLPPTQVEIWRCYGWCEVLKKCACSTFIQGTCCFVSISYLNVSIKNCHVPSWGISWKLKPEWVKELEMELFSTEVTLSRIFSANNHESTMARIVLVYS